MRIRSTEYLSAYALKHTTKTTKLRFPYVKNTSIDLGIQGIGILREVEQKPPKINTKYLKELGLIEGFTPTKTPITNIIINRKSKPKKIEIPLQPDLQFLTAETPLKLAAYFKTNRNEEYIEPLKSYLELLSKSSVKPFQLSVQSLPMKEFLKSYTGDSNSLASVLEEIPKFSEDKIQVYLLLYYCGEFERTGDRETYRHIQKRLNIEMPVNIKVRILESLFRSSSIFKEKMDSHWQKYAKDQNLNTAEFESQRSEFRKFKGARKLIKKDSISLISSILQNPKKSRKIGKILVKYFTMNDTPLYDIITALKPFGFNTETQMALISVLDLKSLEGLQTAMLVTTVIKRHTFLSVPFAMKISRSLIYHGFLEECIDFLIENGVTPTKTISNYMWSQLDPEYNSGDILLQRYQASVLWDRFKFNSRSTLEYIIQVAVRQQNRFLLLDVLYTIPHLDKTIKDRMWPLIFDSFCKLEVDESKIVHEYWLKSGIRDERAWKWLCGSIRSKEGMKKNFAEIVKSLLPIKVDFELIERAIKELMNRIGEGENTEKVLCAVKDITN